MRFVVSDAAEVLQRSLVCTGDDWTERLQRSRLRFQHQLRTMRVVEAHELGPCPRAEAECPVCLDGLGEAPAMRCRVCSYAFHARCVADCAACPTCRGERTLFSDERAS